MKDVMIKYWVNFKENREVLSWQDIVNGLI